METRFSKRKKLLQQRHDHATSSQDRISDLPDHLIHRVFLFLPIKSVARTCVLSKRWKYLWYSFPDLDFTTLNLNLNLSLSLHSKIPKPKSTSLNPLHLYYVDHILRLLHHHSDIRLLRFRGFLTFSRLIALIRLALALKRNVQELDIDVGTSDYFNFPRSITTSRSLKALRLKSSHPGFRLPPLQIMKDGFPSLTSLSLCRAFLDDCTSLVSLFTCSSFPLLKKLTLEACYGLKHLRVESPALEEVCVESCLQLQHLEISVNKLTRLRVSCCFDAYSTSSRVKIKAPSLQVFLWSYNAVTQECSLQNLTRLSAVYVAFFVHKEDLSETKIKSVWNFLNGVSCCESLILGNQCIEILSKKNPSAGMLVCPFSNLDWLELTTDFAKHNNVALVRLFQSCTTIHTLTITVISGQNAERRQWNNDLWQLPSCTVEEGYWETQLESLNSFLHHIKVVNIYGFTECANIVSLIKFLLKHGKVLEQVLLGMTSPRHLPSYERRLKH